MIKICLGINISFLLVLWIYGESVTHKSLLKFCATPPRPVGLRLSIPLGSYKNYWHRTMPVRLCNFVDPRGIESLTSSMPWKRYRYCCPILLNVRSLLEFAFDLEEAVVLTDAFAASE